MKCGICKNGKRIILDEVPYIERVNVVEEENGTVSICGSYK